MDDLPFAEPMGYAGQTGFSPWQQTNYDGSKFPTGYGLTQLLQVDYWTLRARSSELFTKNLYARGIVRRLITNEINTGLTPEGRPEEEIIGVPEESLTGWTESTENRFLLWGKTPSVCDWRQESTFGALQREARREAFVAGDVLVVLRYSRGLATPMVQLVPGDKVRTPLMGEFKLAKGHKIKHGVELDSRSRKVAYWVLQEGGGTKRMPARGSRSGRRLSWLVYGTDKRLDDVRGQPLLSIVLQSLNEIDRYRDSAQRKAWINSLIAWWVQKDADAMGTLPASGGAKRRVTGTVTDNDGAVRKREFASLGEGMIIQELQTGEKIVTSDSKGTDTSLGPFEQVIMQAVAWANEIPPEILTLAFSNNYSASQAAINEFRIYLNLVWSKFGEKFCDPIWIEWMVSEAMTGKLGPASSGLLEVWRDPRKVDIFGAWVAVDWYGSIKPSTDMVKQVKASRMLIASGLSTYAREARILTGTRFTKNVKRLKKENELLAESRRPLAEFEAEFGEDPTKEQALTGQEALEEFLEEFFEDREAA